jgi:TRAP-type C4-dicarboxylate transport system permease small subunit
VLYLIDDILPAIMVAVIVVVMSIDIVLRDCIGTSLPAGVEFSTFLFVWLIFLGGANASRTGTHFSVDITPLLLGAAGRRVVAVLVQLLCVVIAGVLAWSSWFYMLHGWRRLAEGLQVPLGVLYLVLPFAFALMAISHAVRLVMALQALRPAHNLPTESAER